MRVVLVEALYRARCARCSRQTQRFALAASSSAIPKTRQMPGACSHFSQAKRIACSRRWRWHVGRMPFQAEKVATLIDNFKNEPTVPPSPLREEFPSALDQPIAFSHLSRFVAGDVIRRAGGEANEVCIAAAGKLTTRLAGHKLNQIASRESFGELTYVLGDSLQRALARSPWTKGRAYGG